MANGLLFLRLGFKLILLWWISHVHNQVHCLYFAKVNDEVQILLSCTNTSDTFYEGFVLRSSAEPPEVSIDFYLKDIKSNSSSNVTSINFNSTYYSNSEIIGIREASDGSSQTFHLYPRSSFPPKRRIINVEICAKNKDNRPHQAPCLRLKIKIITEAEYCDQTLSSISCFGQPLSNFNFVVYENVEPQFVSRIGQNWCLSKAKCGSNFLENFNYRTETNTSNSFIKLSTDGVLEVISVDREHIERFVQTITCATDSGFNISANVTINVKDENEHGPDVFVLGNKQKIINVSLHEGLNNLLDKRIIIGAKDLDSEPSNYSVTILDDKKGFFNITHEIQIVDKLNPKFLFVSGSLHKMRDVVFEGNSYTFRIRFEDLNLNKPGVSRVDTLFVVIQKHGNAEGDPSILDNIIGQEYEASVIQTAANHSRVEVPQMLNVELRKHSGVRFYLEQSAVIDNFPLDIIPSPGIIYVNNSYALRKMNVSQSYLVKMGWYMSDEAANGNSAHGVRHHHLETEIKPLGYVWINLKLTQNDGWNVAGKDEFCDSGKYNLHNI
ncbi:hypothetical protein CHUAL_014206 [Chamberlinius hualienensis]